MDRDDDKSKYTIHVNMHDGLDGCSYFLKVMLGDFVERLRIPAAFSQKLRKETSEDMVLQGPSAQQWVVKLWGTNSQLEFRQGWEKFVGDHAIESGDFVVFKYVCRSYFKVRIFEKNGCEKKTIIRSENSDKICSDTATATQLPVASDFEEELNDHTEGKVPQVRKKIKFSAHDFDEELNDHIEAKVPQVRKKFKFSSHDLDEELNDHTEAKVPQVKKKFKFSSHETKKCDSAIGRHRHKQSLAGRQEETVKSADTERKSCQESKSCHLPRRRRDLGGRNKAIQAAYSFTSTKPFCLANMAASHVYKRFWLNLPKNSAERLKLPKEMRVVILVNSNCDKWLVRYNWSDSKGRGAFGAGWMQFSVQNNLQKGDICIFERIDKGNNIIKLRVHIYRIAEESNNSEGGISKDRVAIPTYHSNKKMKVSKEDLRTNLPAKLGRPKRGKQGAKHCHPKQGKQGAKHCHPKQGKQGAKHGANQVEEKKNKINPRTNNLKQTESKYVPSKAGYRRSVRFSKRCNLVKPGKKELLCLPSSSARDTVVLSDETTHVDGVNGEEGITSVDDVNVEEEEEDTMIVLDCNGEPHAMAPQSDALNQFMRISLYPKMK
ncbi:B3 domain-containing protein Os11g0197600 isoform X2 [Cryptomeria japonica]|uniref:B3 domain-containing protein Os11g0197600 isoform X2 n=1 Tax=Cryptomeria japonica TaxID=3369 RepID=UPI0025AB8156|nr:B3 domain-containing protein Os11g0197600 isoform X2 [Cryptomeria japonica]